MKEEIIVNIPYHEEDKHLNLDGSVINLGNYKITIISRPTTQTKDFLWYIDQYLPSTDNSTCDEIHNWMHQDQISVLVHRLKTNQFSLVPWEIKIGLFKFIVLEHNLTVDDIFNFYVSYVDGSCAMVTQRLIPTLSICPTQFLDSIFDIKQNKND